MNLSIGTFGSEIRGTSGGVYTGRAGEMPSALLNREPKQALTPAQETDREQERRERMGISDPSKPDDAIGKTADDEKAPGRPRLPGEKRKPGEECETCRKRKYKDASNEMVSFKSASHISPESAAAQVRAHEQQHVSNAYKKAALGDGKVISASVSIQTAVCPECGRTYVSGGTTHTQIKYYNEDNPYQKGLKTADQAKYAGMNADYAV